MTRLTGTLHEDLYIFVVISHSVLHRMINISEQVGENIKTQNYVQ